MKIDINKANAAINEYIETLQKPNIMPRQISSLYWTDICMERHGIIPDRRKIDLLDHCVLWVTCIVACDRVREVSRIEVQQHALKTGQSLQKTLNKWKKERHYRQYLDRINKHLTDTLKTDKTE